MVIKDENQLTFVVEVYNSLKFILSISAKCVSVPGYTT